MDQYNSVTLTNINEVYVKVDCDPSIAYELRDHFTFRVPGAEFSPKFRAKLWDGKIYLFNPINKLLYRGHTNNVRDFCESRGYSYHYQNSIIPFEYNDAVSFINQIRPKYTPKDYQIDAVVQALSNKRQVLLSPTASGKSLIIYILARNYLLSSKKTLIIVPKVQLVEQLASDFIDYSELNGWEVENNIHRIYSGKEKQDDSKKIYISTWQSLFELPKKYFERFDAVINDECVHPDTFISMADGTKKKIKEINIGDSVKTFNEKTKNIENKEVLKVHENISINEDFYEIETENGKILHITGNHKVLLTSGIWKRVDELEVGDIINSSE